MARELQSLKNEGERTAFRTLEGHPERLPDFLAVGPPRTASTWLDGLLRGRANLPEGIKETRFFDKRFRMGLAWYARYFEHAQPGIPTGEIAPTYFHSVAARKRIADLLPGAKILISLRHPVDRFYSHYRQRVADHSLHTSFREAAISDPVLIESARYVFHLREWFEVFGRERVRVVIYEDLLHEPERYVRQIFDYLGLVHRPLRPDDFIRVNSSESARVPRHPIIMKLAVPARDALEVHRLEWPRRIFRRFHLGPLVERLRQHRGELVAPLDPDLKADLCRKFKSEVEGVERTLGRDLSMWKTP